YLAAPLFTPYERAYVDEVAAALRSAGHEVFVPHENLLAAKDTTAADVFAKDLGGLEGAEAVVAVLDGPMVDDGTACELGLFYGLMQGDPARKGIVGLLTDFRGTVRSEGHGLNLFVKGCVEAVGEVCESVDDVLAALERLGESHPLGARVSGIGGVFVRAARPAELAAWYAEHLGLERQPYGGVTFRAADGDVTIWSLFEEATDYFGPSGQRQMVNFRVSDIDAVVARLREAGVPVELGRHESEHGRFAWATDPEGNRFELWEPPPVRYPDG
ncbi:MAG TPA: nucleoside 2-deoxyribosyltransferase, partial [Gaiellaceae bacterium]